MKASVSNVSSAFKGDPKVLTDRFFERFNVAYDNIFSLSWLLTGEGEMLKGGEEGGEAKGGGGGYRLVPLANVDSVGGMESANDVTDEPQFVLGLVPFTDAREGDVAIRQSGESMSPSIPAGSVLLIRRVEGWREYFGYGGIFVLELTDGRRVTKEVRRCDEDPRESVLCVSHNPAFAPERLPRRCIRSVWKVIKVLIDNGW